jgi:hypothetical protein
MVFAIGKVRIPPELAARLSSGIVARVSVARPEREGNGELKEPVSGESTAAVDPLNL